MQLPASIVTAWGLENVEYDLEEKLYGKVNAKLYVDQGQAKVRVDLKPLESWILEVKGVD